MLFSKLLVAAVTLAAASAKVVLTNTAFDGIANNVPFTITWSGQNGAVTLKLNNGPSLAQVFVTTITTGQMGQSFTWTPLNLPTGTYIIEIDDSTDVNYSIPFSLAGVAVTSSSTSPSTLSTSSTTAPSSTSSTSTTFTTSAPTASSVTSRPASSSTTAAANKTTLSSGTANITASRTPSPTITPTPGSAARYGSPLALVVVAFIALFFLH